MLSSYDHLMRAVDAMLVRSRKGRLTHALSLTSPERTGCGRSASGWRVSTAEKADCPRCEAYLLTHSEAWWR